MQTRVPGRRLLTILALLFAARGALAQTLEPPERRENTIVVASYNIKWLGYGENDYERLARVIEHFDVCGVLEIKREEALRDLRDALEAHTGEEWGYVYGVRTHRPGGRYHEAYGALWRRDRVQLGDGVVSNAWDLEEAYRNDPFFVSFRAGEFDFTLLLVHTRYSDDEEGTRLGEVRMLPEQINWMRGVTHEKDIILAGDFNYGGEHEEMRAMAIEAGLERINANAPSTFKTDGSGFRNPYDHMYISAVDTAEYDGACEVLDPTEVAYGTATAAHRKRARTETSDHAPVWARFRTDMPDDD